MWEESMEYFLFFDCYFNLLAFKKQYTLEQIKMGIYVLVCVCV